MLTGKQRQHLRALAHHKDPVVQLGKEGLSESVVAQVDQALLAHELIKVKLGGECPIGRDEAADALAAALRADVAQVIGHVIVLFRRRPKKPKVPLTKRAEKGKQRAKRSKGGGKGGGRKGGGRKGGRKAKRPESGRHKRTKPGPRGESSPGKRGPRRPRERERERDGGPRSRG